MPPFLKITLGIMCGIIAVPLLYIVWGIIGLLLTETICTSIPYLSNEPIQSSIFGFVYLMCFLGFIASVSFIVRFIYRKSSSKDFGGIPKKD